MDEQKEVQTARVELPVFDWHILLRTIEFSMNIVGGGRFGVDEVNTRRIYEAISTQLSHTEVKTL
jgi:hypothetical protein